MCEFLEQTMGGATQIFSLTHYYFNYIFALHRRGVASVCGFFYWEYPTVFPPLNVTKPPLTDSRKIPDDRKPVGFRV